jgi:predicted pyridoxine 5'-phosphate oxidase superfamily flavin-nucleotide-binding protein
MLLMKLTSHLPDDRRAHVEGRLRANLMAWLTTVRADGRPDSVPVWFLLRDDETILMYSQAGRLSCATSATTRGFHLDSM